MKFRKYGSDEQAWALFATGALFKARSAKDAAIAADQMLEEFRKRQPEREDRYDDPPGDKT